MFSNFFMKSRCFLLFVGVEIKGSVQCSSLVPLCDVNCNKNSILCRWKFVKIKGLLYNDPMTFDMGFWPPSIVLSKLELNINVIFCDWRSDRLAAMMFWLK